MIRSRGHGPLAPDFHPEFGLLCPSARLRRILRRVLACAAAAAAVGATMVWGVPQVPAARTSGATALAAAMPEQVAAEAPATPARIVRPVALTRPAAHADASSGARMRADCTNLATWFLEPACRAGKLHSRHGMRGKNRVATYVFSHTGTSPEPQSAQPSLAAAPGERSRPAAVAASTTPAATSSSEHPSAPVKKKATPNAPTAQIAPKPESGAVRAYAAVPRPARDVLDGRGADRRAAALLPIFGGAFKGIW
jgi:hypothetical protein